MDYDNRDSQRTLHCLEGISGTNLWNSTEKLMSLHWTYPRLLSNYRTSLFTHHIRHVSVEYSRQQPLIEPDHMHRSVQISIVRFSKHPWNDENLVPCKAVKLPVCSLKIILNLIKTIWATIVCILTLKDYLSNTTLNVASTFSRQPPQPGKV